MLGRLVVVLCVLAGCDRLFELQHVDGPVDADGSGADADAGAPCTVVETFDGNKLSAMWEEYNTNSDATIAVVGGQFRVDPPPSTSAYNGMFGSTGYDLTDGSVEVEMVQPLMAGHTDMQLVVQPDFTKPDAFLIFIGGGSYIGFRRKIGTTFEERTPTYDPVNHRFVRIRFEGSDVVFETSETGAAGAWNERYRLPAGLPCTNLHVMLLAGTYDPPPDVPGAALYDNLKICAAGQH